jgi:hypothetical protein
MSKRTVVVNGSFRLGIDEKNGSCRLTSGLMTNNSVNMQRRQKLNVGKRNSFSVS